MVDESALDIGLIRTPLLESPKARMVPLEFDTFIAALPRGSFLAAKCPLSLSDFANESFIMYSRSEGAGLHSAAMLACQQAGFLPNVTQEATQIQTMLALVESGLGVALVPSVMQRFANERIVYRKLTDYPSAAAIGLALLYRPEMENAAAQCFCNLATRVYPQLML